jgi:thymidylate kinase
MIIVEGPDGSGKTTTIQRLGYERRQLKALRQGIGSEGANPKGWGGDDPALLAYTKKVREAQQDEMANPPGSDAYGTLIAFDRFHLSEAAYAPILRPTASRWARASWRCWARSSAITTCLSSCACHRLGSL